MTAAARRSVALAGAVLAATLAGAAGLAGAADPVRAASEVGVVNHLAGLVTVSNGHNTARAQAYMNIRVGDMFDVPAGVVVKVAYFQGGRQESFAGPVSFTVGSQQSQVLRGTAPQVSQLPAGVPQKISQTPELVQIAKFGAAAHPPGPAGSREVRLTPQQQAEARQAREVYARLRADTPGDDITPELYLYSVLQDLLLYGEMKTLVAEMARRQPGNRDVAALAEYVRLKTEPR